MKKRYKHKLNMLEPGLLLCNIIGIFLATGILFLVFRLHLIAYVMFGGAAITFLCLIILIMIEQYQDRMDYLDAKKEDPEIK